LQAAFNLNENTKKGPEPLQRVGPNFFQEV